MKIFVIAYVCINKNVYKFIRNRSKHIGFHRVEYIQKQKQIDFFVLLVFKTKT